MTSDNDFESTRRFALGEVKRLVGIVDPSADKLFSKARTVLGADRANRCLELARLAPLTRRWVPASAIASLIVGAEAAGPRRWSDNRSLTRITGKGGPRATFRGSKVRIDDAG